jgi:Protein of unknown function (DUF3168)
MPDPIAFGSPAAPFAPPSGEPQDLPAEEPRQAALFDVPQFGEPDVGFGAPPTPPDPPDAIGLIEAAIAWLKTSTDFAAVYSDELPAAVLGAAQAYPYLVLTEISDVPDWDSGGAWTGRYQFQIAAVHRGKALARIAGRAARSWLADAPLAFQDGPLLYLRPDSFLSPKEAEKGPGGIDLWRCVVTFNALTSEEL